jgi:hypothetical protein
MDDKRYVVCNEKRFSAEDTRVIRSKTPMSKSVAEAWVKLLNKQYPQLQHWVSEANEEEMAYLRAKLARGASGQS